MGNVLSSLSSVPATHPTPRELEEIQHQESETFQVECVVCLTDRLIFKKMHHSWSPETGHYVCLDCFWSWKLSCSENRSHLPDRKQLLCPLCGIDDCYLFSMSVHVACYGCKTLRRSERFMAHGGAHVIENHPGCTLCWECITEAPECPICGFASIPAAKLEPCRPGLCQNHLRPC